MVERCPDKTEALGSIPSVPTEEMESLLRGTVRQRSWFQFHPHSPMFKTCFCGDIPQEGIHKIGAIAIKDRKLLVVRKRGKEEFIIPGGKHERDESFEECLRRELHEELQVNLTHFHFLKDMKVRRILKKCL